MNKQNNKLTPLNLFFIILGSTLYALSINLFLVPLKLYSGGVPGLSQVLRTSFFSSIVKIDIAGIINLLFNVPLFILAYRKMSKKMVIGTLISVLTQTILFTLIKAPAIPILDEKLALILISGILGGVGCGIILTNGGSGGGLDLLGVYFTTKYKKFSVGLLTILFNSVLYTIMAILFDLSTALYSIIYIAVFSIIIDRWHLQNIEVQLMIFTHKDCVKEIMLYQYTRGVTQWEGKGAYTNDLTHVLVTIVSKFEVESVKKEILKIDPQAFIIENQNINVTGGYQKRL